MASIRKLKKEVNYVTYELLTETFAYKHFHPGMEEDKFDEVIKNLVKTRNEIINRINNPGEASETLGMREHFQKLKQELAQMVRELEKLN